METVKGGLLKNTWLDEIQVRECARFISHCLAFSFGGKEVDEDAWGKFALAHIRKVSSQRIRDSLMWKYTFRYELDEQERVQLLEFVRLPWLL